MSEGKWCPVRGLIAALRGENATCTCIGQSCSFYLVELQACGLVKEVRQPRVNLLPDVDKEYVFGPNVCTKHLSLEVGVEKGCPVCIGWAKKVAPDLVK